MKLTKAICFRLSTKVGFLGCFWGVCRQPRAQLPFPRSLRFSPRSNLRFAHANVNVTFSESPELLSVFFSVVSKLLLLHSFAKLSAP